MTRLAFHFHIRPWEIDLLTIDEFYGFCDAIEKMEEAG
jgi:hypothetical protein